MVIKLFGNFFKITVAKIFFYKSLKGRTVIQWKNKKNSRQSKVKYIWHQNKNVKKKYLKKHFFLNLKHFNS